jgi:hypothetical protein
MKELSENEDVVVVVTELKNCSKIIKTLISLKEVLF